MEVLQAVDAERLRSLRDRGEFFWLDLTDPGTADLDTLDEFLTIHHLAAEDTREFGQRAKLDDYSDSALLVFYGAEPRTSGLSRLVEVHLHISSQALVTVTREPCNGACRGAPPGRREFVDERGSGRPRGARCPGRQPVGCARGVRRRDRHPAGGGGRARDDREPSTGFRVASPACGDAPVVVPQRDLLAPDCNLFDVIPDLHGEGPRVAFRDVYDHLDRATKLVGSYREQLASLLDLYLSEVSTRLNEFMRRLSVIGTVFLPLSFLVGFFGMNFGWLQQVIAPAWTFFVSGIALLIVSGGLTAAYLRRTGTR